MSPEVMTIGTSMLLFVSGLACVWKATAMLPMRKRLSALGLLDRPFAQAIFGSQRTGSRPFAWRVPAQTVALAGLGGGICLKLAALPGLLVGCLAGAFPLYLERRRRRRITEAVERQLAEVAEGTAVALRGGLSVSQAISFVATEIDQPMAERLRRLTDEHRLGTSFEVALRRFTDGLGTEDAELFSLVVSIHARSGGNLAGALDGVASTIRHRIGVRRELQALSAQGRISGAVLGSLPIGFFLLVATTSHRQLAPVYGSTAGIAMVSVGLAMELLAFVWIRRLLDIAI